MPKTDWRDLASTRYLDALAAGDLDAITAIWAEAATNPELEALLHELNQELLQEAPPMSAESPYTTEKARRKAEHVIALALSPRLPDHDITQIIGLASTIMDAIVEPSTSWTFAHLLGFSVQRWMEYMQAEATIATDIADQLVAHWPDQHNGGPVLYHHSDGTWWLETLRADVWRHCKSGPYADRTEAVRAWLDTVAAQAPTTAPPSEVQAAAPSSAGGST